MSAPAIPTGIYITTGNTQVCLNWGIVPNATSYLVQRSPDGVTFSSLGAPAVNFYVDSTAVVGTNYYYQVAAVTSGGGGGTSAYNGIGTNGLPLQITPCPPGQVNLGYLRYQMLLKADLLKNPFITVDEANFIVNQCAYELYDLLVLKYGDDYFFSPPILYSLTGALSYPLPDGLTSYINGNTGLSFTPPAMFKLNGVDVNISGGSAGPNAAWVPIPRCNWSDRDRYTTFPGQAGALNNVYQMAYREMGNQLYIFPQNINQTIRVWQVPIMTQLLLDTDMLPFSISGWSEMIMVDGAIKMLLKEESFDQANMMMQRKQQILARIEQIASNRDVGQPNTVSNTRATMGDPGFQGWGYGSGSNGFGSSGGF